MRTFIAASIIIFLCSCKKNNSTYTPPPLELKSDSSSINLAALAGSRDSFSIISNINWSVSTSPGTATWFTISATSGTGNEKIYVTTNADNTSSTNRVATIVLNPVGAWYVTPVTINLSQSSIYIPSSSFLLWQKSLGGSDRDYGNAIVATSDGGYLMAGYTSSTNGDVTGAKGDRDIWLVKSTNSGAIVWQKTLGGSAFDWAFGLINTSDGGYALVGQTLSSNGDVSSSHGSGDIWVVKLDNSGNIAWQKCLGGTNDDIGYSIAQAGDGSLFVTGRTLSSDGDAAGYHGGADVLASKLDINGNVVWSKTIGGGAQDVGWGITATPDNGCIITGNTASNDGDITAVHGGSDLLLVRLDSAGNIQWQKAYGGSGGEQGDAVIATGDGGYMIVGASFSSDGDVSGNYGGIDGWILKVDGAGILQWQKNVGGRGDDSFHAINRDSQGNFIIAGLSTSDDKNVPSNNGSSDCWAVLLDTNGNIKGSRTFGGTEEDGARATISTTDGRYLIAGYTASSNGDISGFHGGLYDAWIGEFKFQ
jgi:hypothetical protein